MLIDKMTVQRMFKEEKKNKTVVHVWLKWAVCAKHTEAEQNS